MPRALRSSRIGVVHLPPSHRMQTDIREIAEYCESDVVNTYRVWLRYELFRGRLSTSEFQASETGLIDFIKARGNTKPHLADLM
jgi:3'-5' exonuclease